MFRARPVYALLRVADVLTALARRVVPVGRSR
jgi:hypothetical protein